MWADFGSIWNKKKKYFLKHISTLVACPKQFFPMNITYDRLRKQKIPVLRTPEPLHQFARTERSLDFFIPNRKWLLSAPGLTQHGNPEICVEKNIFFSLNSFEMLTRFSKCDFWIPGQILDFKNVVWKKTFFFEIKKNLEKVWNIEKVGNFRNFKDFQWVSLVKY